MDPAPMSVKSFTPPSLEKLVRRCLEKDAEDRWQSIRDVLLELRSIQTQPEAGEKAAAKRPRIAWALAALSAAAALALAAIHFREQPPVERPIRFEIPLPADASLTFWQIPAVSPDGMRIVFPTVRGNQSGAFYMRPLSLAASHLFVEQLGWDPCWSADSKNVTFSARGSVQRAEVSGGPPQKLFDTRSGTWGLACSPQTILIGRGAGPLLQWSPSGGEPKPLTKLDASRNETGHQFPQFLPDSRGFIFTAASQGEGSIFAGSLDSNQVKLLLPNTLRAVFVPNGYLLYLSGPALMARRFDWKTLAFSGEPVRVADTVYQPAEDPFYASFSASADVLAYRTGVADTGSELVWLDRAGKRIATVGERADYTNPALSPDGNRLAIGRTDPVSKKRDIWIVDLVRGTNSRLTFDPADDLNPVWSPDGKDIVFSSDRSVTNNERHLFKKAANGIGAEQAIAEGPGRNSVESWSPDGKFLVYNNATDVVMFPLAGGKAQTIIGGPGGQDQAAISPDGKWIAYRSNESGRPEIYVQNFPPAGGKWQISTNAGQQPSWRGDGKELYYLQRNEMMSVPVKGDTKEFQAGTPSSLFQVQTTIVQRRNHYVVTRDGSRFLFLMSNTDAMKNPISVVVNWAAGLTK
jgi:Tol biopolymer transport system component